MQEVDQYTVLTEKMIGKSMRMTNSVNELHQNVKSYHVIDYRNHHSNTTSVSQASDEYNRKSLFRKY